MKKLTLFVGIFLLSLIARGQNDPNRIVTETNPDLSDDVAYLLQNLDFSGISSGILLERGFPMRNPAPYDGTQTADTLWNYADWFMLYGTLVTSVVDSTKRIGTTSDWKPETDSLYKAGTIPIMAMHLDYHKFIADSIQFSNLIYEQGGQLYDYPNQSTSPYEADEVFSFATKRSTLNNKLSWDFLFKNDFFITNTGKTVSSVQVDFDNGQGYTTITLGNPLKVSWTTYGAKYLKLKISYSDATIYYATSLLKLGGTFTPKYNSAPDFSHRIEHPVYSDYGATLNISYGCGNDKLVKPFIFVEGFNPEFFENDYEGLIKNIGDYEEFYPTAYQFLDDLNANGYDIVYVDFDRGTGDLIENAKNVENAIKWVNEKKAENSSSLPNIVTGYSMGGVIARLALTGLEDEGYDHETSYYVSVDAPHLGANLPRSIIESALDVYNLTYNTFQVGQDIPKLEAMIELLYSPAARQMLIYGVGPYDHAALKDELDARGMPANTIQNIAVSKGNGIGANQGFGSLDDLVNIDIDIWHVGSCINPLHNLSYLEDVALHLVGGIAYFAGFRLNIEVDIKAGPSYTSTPFKIYERKIRIKIPTVINIGPSSLLVKTSHKYFYDGAPGGSFGFSSFNLPAIGFGDSDDIIEDLMSGAFSPCVDLHATQFCFLPAVSALNIESMLETPSAAIDPVAIVANNKTPFDKAYILDPSKYPTPSTAPTNESHLSFTPSNLFPYSEILSPDFNAVNDNPTVHGYTFNFGLAQVGNEVMETTDRIEHPLTVSGISSANGALWVNRDDNLENVNDNNNPISTSNHFSVELRKSCDGNYGRVTVESLGSIVIGEDDLKTADVVVRDNCWIKMNDGFIEVRDGSKLIIEDGAELRLNGGLLRVQDGGEVIIKAGGKLIYEDGAQIELNGNDAVLALGGLTRIGNDATFTFTYQGNESGYIRMLSEGYWGQRFSVGTDAEFRLEGENAADLILYMEESADFWEYTGGVPGETSSSHKFDYVQFKKGKIIMEDDARIVLINDARFINTRVEPFDNVHPPRGITTYTFCDIRSSSLNRINIDAKLNVFESGALYLTTSDFDYSLIKVRGYGTRVRDCLFEHSNIQIDQSSISNTVQESLFRYDSGISDLSSTELFIYKTEFFHNEYPVYKELGRVTAKCSDFTDNDYAIYAANFGEVNLSSLYNGGYNYFDDNDYNVYLSLAYGIIMEDGYNQFYDGNIMNVEGTLDIPHNPCPKVINANNNIWTPLSDTSVPYVDLAHPDEAEFNVTIESFPGGPNNQIYCHIPFHFGTVAQIAYCGEFDDPRDPKDPEEGPKSDSESVSFPFIYSPTYFDSIPFDIALRQAAATTTVSDTLTGDDLLAADMYYELLELAVLDSIPNDSIAGLIEGMKWRGLGNYKATIERLFAYGVITKVENQSIFNPTVENYVSVLMAFTDSVKTQANYKPQFGLELMKASLFKTIGKKNEALHILQNMNYCDQDSIQKLILEAQIQNITFDLLAETYGADMYLADSITFELDSSIYQIPLESYIDTTGFGSYIEGPNSIYYSSCNDAFRQKSFGASNGNDLKFNVYPNPTRTKLEVQILDTSVDMEAGFTFVLIDFTGKTMFSQRIVSIHSTMNLPKLASALYFYQIQSKGKLVEQGKISILN